MAKPNSNFNPIVIRRFTNSLTYEKVEIRRFQSERFVFTVQLGNTRYKTFQIIFGKSDGSIYVNFPYFDFTEGILSEVTYPGYLPSAKIDLKTKGMVTSKRVKYAHHPDGETHFSQAGKGNVSTSIRKKSIPLRESEGHIFSLNIQGLEYYKTDDTEQDHLPKKSKTTLNFKLENKTSTTLKFVAHWYKPGTFLNQVKGKNFGPIVNTETPDKKRNQAFLIGAPLGFPMSEFVLLISCQETPPINEELDATLIFVGGFAPRKKGNDLHQELSFLCLTYPVSDYENLVEQIESIDMK